MASTAIEQTTAIGEATRYWRMEQPYQASNHSAVACRDRPTENRPEMNFASVRPPVVPSPDQDFALALNAVVPSPDRDFATSLMATVPRTDAMAVVDRCSARPMGQMRQDSTEPHDNNRIVDNTPHSEEKTGHNADKGAMAPRQTWETLRT